ncbi:MAG: NAD-dependent epimerase/dehydratase family protein [Acidimicrobiales bacterium]
MRVLVLGGNRYIGLHLVRELARRGHEVTVANSHEVELPAGVDRIHVDRRLPGALVDALRDQACEFDVIYDNTSYQPSDVAPLVELLRGRVAHYVFTSSAAVYRRSWIQPVGEGSRRHDPADTDPRKSYGVGKVGCEELLLSEHRNSGFPATVLRVSHTIGPMSPLVTREPVFFERLRTGRPIPIPGDGFSVVHLVDVADVADCMASIAAKHASFGQAYNIAGPELASVLGCVRLMAEAAGVEPDVVHVPLDVARQLSTPLVHWGEAIMGPTMLSTAKLRDEMGWVPATGLREAYRRSFEWWSGGGRERYDYDFAHDDRVLARLAGIQ